MIQKLEIMNFKSIRSLQLDCKKVNVFIGKPNTGKSNILESLGVFSFPYVGGKLRSLIRFENMADLFYDYHLEEKMRLIADDNRYEIRFEDQRFIGTARDKDTSLFDFEFGYSEVVRHSVTQTSPFRFYRFLELDKFPRADTNYLLPPGGDNLLHILLTNKAERKFVSDLFSQYGLRIVLKPQEFKIEVQKEVEDVIIGHPYSLVSDTLRRIVFHLMAVETNNDAIIIFEEPEAHAFPFYTKFLAERIALDKTNQYFISTHNPYFLFSLLEKTPETEVAIFITYLEEYQTKVKPLAGDDLREILDLDYSVFFNLDRFLGEM
jgi:hypothetical protein